MYVVTFFILQFKFLLFQQILHCFSSTLKLMVHGQLLQKFQSTSNRHNQPEPSPAQTKQLSPVHTHSRSHQPSPHSFSSHSAQSTLSPVHSGSCPRLAQSTLVPVHTYSSLRRSIKYKAYVKHLVLRNQYGLISIMTIVGILFYTGQSNAHVNEQGRGDLQFLPGERACQMGYKGTVFLSGTHLNLAFRSDWQNFYLKKKIGQ